MVSRAVGRGSGTLYRPTYKVRGEVRTSGIWRWKLGDHVNVSTGCRAKADAERWRMARLAEMGRGSRVGLKAAVLRYEDCEAMLLDAHDLEGRRSHPESELRHLRAHFGGWLAVDITPSAAREYAAKKRAQGYEVATVNLHLARLRRALRLAWQSGRLPSAPYVPMLPGARVRRGFLELGDVEAIVSALPQRYRSVVRFLALTGWRLGEALHLEWRRVDREAQEIRLDTSKSGAPRCVPYSTYPPLRELIEAQAKERRGLCPYVFSVRALRPISRGAVEKAWRAACEATGHGDSLLHDLRRSFVRRCERVGVPRQIAMSLTGHASEQIYSRYAISDRSAQELGLAMLAAEPAQEVVKDFSRAASK
jgi:integrase